jgi:hypothetical protein
MRRSWLLRVVFLAFLAVYLVWRAFEFGWESALLWLVLLIVSFAVLTLFLRLLARQERTPGRVVLWAIFLALALGIPALLWFGSGGNALGLVVIFVMAGVVALVFAAVARLMHRDASH